MAAIEPFRIDIAEGELEDLKSRLANTRWPEKETPDDWSQGIPLAYVREVADYWLNAYDWRRAEARINAHDQFTTEIDGLDIHFLHVRSPHEHALPLVMTHGWPGSIVEFLKVIGPLTRPEEHGGDSADAFHLVCPALPGYGFSGKPAEPGWGVEKIADTWAALMARLGYGRYVAQGGDWGALVTMHTGPRDPEHCAAIHLNMVVATPDPDTMSDLTPQEKLALEGMAYYQQWDSGYSKQQSTPAADPGLRPGGLPRRADGLDLREVLALDGLRRPSGKRPHPGRNARQRDAVLAHRLGRLLGPPVLGELRGRTR